MSTDLEKISQISIYLKNSEKVAEKVNEVALLNPLSKKASFDEENETLHQRKWTFHHQLSLSRRFFLNIQTFFFHRFKVFIPEWRKTPEAKFKTTLSILLAQESLREYFLGSLEKRERFFAAASRGAALIGYSFMPPPLDLPLDQMARELTLLPFHHASLIEDLEELNLQMAALPTAERSEILFTILSNIERPPLTSVVEVATGESALEIELETKYAKIQVHSVDAETGKIDFTVEENYTTSNIDTHSNFSPGKKGVMNQRMVLEKKNPPQFVGSYCGALLTPHNILEQLLFIFQEEKALDATLLEALPPGKIHEEKRVLFTSLFSWNEYGKIIDEHRSIDELHGKYLRILQKEGSERIIHLTLYHQNLSFNALNKFPTPSETKANLKDINDEMLIQLLLRAWNFLNLPRFDELTALGETIEEGRKESDYLNKQRKILQALDTFKTLKKHALDMLSGHQHEVALSLIALLTGKVAEHKKLNKMDALVYTTILTHHLGIVHNKNCDHSTDRTDGANAADKAQYAFRKVRGASFLPGHSSFEEKALFKVLYSMYLVWEEPELNAGLSTGFVGEKFFRGAIKNPETTRYLTSWLKTHPEMYLGLSDYRS